MWEGASAGEVKCKRDTSMGGYECWRVQVWESASKGGCE